MRISDWSSDVCSSDLRTAPRLIPTKAAAGEADLQARGLSFADATALKQAEKDGRIKVHLWPVGRGAQLALYPNLNAVAPGWRAALRDVRFRRALSLGIAPAELNQVLYQGHALPGPDAQIGRAAQRERVGPVV